MPNRISSKEQPAARRPEAVQLRARRSPKVIAVGILAVVLGALGSAALYSSANSEENVVSIAKPVSRGTVILDEHLMVVPVPERFAAEAVAADDIGTLVGQTALTDLPEGAFPHADHVGENPLPAGEALVGLRMTHGQLPSTPMPAGTAVELVAIGESQPASNMRGVVAVEPLPLDDGMSFALDVRVAADSATQIARLSAENQLAVIVVKEE